MKTKDELNVLDLEDARYRLEFRSVAREHLRDYVEAVTSPAPRFGKNAYICPCCKSGAGNNGKYTPGFTLFRTQAGELHFKCHACGITGDIFKLAGLVHNAPDFAVAERVVASFLGIDLARRTPLSEIRVTDPKAGMPPTQKETMRLKKEACSYIKKCQKDVGLTDFFHQRGLNDDTIQRFGLGYDPESEQAVIPFSSTYYKCRNTEIGADQKGVNKHHSPYGLRQPLFNLTCLVDAHEPVFLTEAPLDAMSIVQCGGNALALGGSSTATLTTILNVYRPGNVFILALDSDKPGLRLQGKVAELLDGRGIPYTIPQHEAFTAFKDANATLMSAPEVLKAGVAAEAQRAIELVSETSRDDSITAAARKAIGRLSRNRREAER